MKNIVVIILFLAPYYAQCQEAKDLLKREFEEVFNQRKFDVVDEIFADKYLLNNMPQNTHDTVERAGFKNFLKQLTQAIPDVQYTVPKQ